MKIVMTLLVRNEEDILRQNIDYHLAKGVDFIIARDNRSIDGTRDILMTYERMGVLQYQYEPDDDYRQCVWVTQMARLAFTRYQADWVINSDADEFWWPENGGTLKKVLSEVSPRIHGLAVSRVNFRPRPETAREGFLKTMTCREITSFNCLGDPLPSKICHRAAANIHVSQGNHEISAKGHDTIVVDTDEMVIFHFPVRALQQITTKIACGGRAYEQSSLPESVGQTWRKLYKQLNAEGLEGYYREQLVDDDQLQQAIEDKTMVEDRRLLEFFNTYLSGEL